MDLNRSSLDFNKLISENPINCENFAGEGCAGYTKKNSQKCMIDGDVLEIVVLGAGCEVGRSCVVIKFKNKTVMFDCGIHPALSGVGSLPVFDAVDVGEIDLCLITHFHLDHCGALPYFVCKTCFEGKVYMTEPTKAICKLLWLDYARMDIINNDVSTNNDSRSKLSRSYQNECKRLKINQNLNYFGVSNHIFSNDNRKSNQIDQNLTNNFDHNSTKTKKKNLANVAEVVCNDGVLFNEDDIYNTIDKISVIDLHEECTYNDILFIPYKAGHVLGACMFLVEISGVRILYTGDFSREEDRHIPCAEIPPCDVHVLICESTYGIRVNDERKSRENRFLQSLHQIIRRKGKCLLPVFALGRAQEITLILEEYWEKNHSILSKIPIFYVSPMYNKSIEIFEAYINMCNEKIIQKASEGINPFNFKYVKAVRSLDSIRSYIHNDESCVVLAAPGMLQSGASREIFENWVTNEKNGVILTGYAVKGTIADDLKKECDVINLPDRVLKRRCTFDEISFSAHTDFNQTQEFIERLQTPNVVLVHGERNEMFRLKQKLIDDRPALSVFTPEILQKVCLKFKADVSSIVLGTLAEHLLMSEKQIMGTMDAKKDELKKSQTSDCDDNSTLNRPNSDEIDETPLEVIKNIRDDINSEIDIDGIIAVKGLDNPIIMKCDELYSYFNEIEVAEVMQNLDIVYPFDNLKYLEESLTEIFDDIEEFGQNGLLVCGKVKVQLNVAKKIITISWMSSTMADLIGDSILFIAIDHSRFSGNLKKLRSPVEHHSANKSNQSERIIRDVIKSFISENFGIMSDFEMFKDKDFHDDIIRFKLNDLTSGENELVDVTINFGPRKVICENYEIKRKVESSLRQMEASLLPLSLS